MGKLIDADELKDALFQKHVHDWEELEPMLYLEDAMKVVDNAPAIPAIPVGWLIDRANDPERAPLYRRYAQMLYEEWQKEQEAKRPEPVYPTWVEWFRQMKMIPPEQKCFHTWLLEPIPADIAQKLEIEPKEG